MRSDSTESVFLAAVRESIAVSGDVIGCATLDFNIARAYVLLASGDLRISKVKNPGLLMLLPVAARRARAALEDVKKTLIEHGLVDRDRARAYFDEIEPELYRFPAIAPEAFRRRVEDAL